MGKVDVILLNDVKGIGEKDKVVSVADGYARNYLLPQHMAVIANNDTLKNLEKQQAENKLREAEELKNAEQIKNQIDGSLVHVYAKGGKDGKLFGSVTSKDVASALNTQFGICIDKRKIERDYDSKETEKSKPVDTFGTYNYRVKIHKDVVAKIRVQVSEEEAGA